MHLTGGDAAVRYEESENMSSFEHEEMMMIAKSKVQFLDQECENCDDDAIAMHTSQRLPTRRVLRESLSKVSACEQSDGEAIIGLNVPVRLAGSSVHA